jgi:DeoR/GlpR family transcriptional regulator of sugar metabolism
MIRAARLKEIRSRLERDGALTVSELARGFGKTPITIRRDLEVLEGEGYLTRTHGGAIAAGPGTNEPSPYGEREMEAAREKWAVARRAADYVEDGDSLILNAGTTMRALARCLKNFRDLQVVTNGITLVSELTQAPGAQVLLLGGEVDAKKMGTVGPQARDMLGGIHVAKAFLGISGLSVERGLLMHSSAEAEINAAFVGAADEVTVAVDSRKFGINLLYGVAPLSAVQRIITDGGIGADARRAVERAGVDLVIAEDG